MRNADAYIREFNVAHPDTPITIQHMLMWAIAQILEQYPTMNRFVVGGRLYQRNGHLVHVLGEAEPEGEVAAHRHQAPLRPGRAVRRHGAATCSASSTRTATAAA